LSGETGDEVVPWRSERRHGFARQESADLYFYTVVMFARARLLK